MTTSAVARELLDRCVEHLRGEYLPRLETALSILPADDLWWRPHADTTSVGNLLLHLEGNVRQWILSGLGGVDDRRRRSTEFAARESEDSAAVLMRRLRGTVEQACEVIAGLDDAELLRARTIQVFDGTTALAAVVHVTEHFAWHTGQITWIAKLRAGDGHGLDYYEDTELE